MVLGVPADCSSDKGKPPVSIGDRLKLTGGSQVIHGNHSKDLSKRRGLPLVREKEGRERTLATTRVC